MIEKISDAVGTIYLPIHIKRVAKAEAEEKKIEALINIEITEIKQRALKRHIQEEGKKQENIENITAEALGRLKGEI